MSHEHDPNLFLPTGSTGSRSNAAEVDTYNKMLNYIAGSLEESMKPLIGKRPDQDEAVRVLGRVRKLVDELVCSIGAKDLVTVTVEPIMEQAGGNLAYNLTFSGPAAIIELIKQQHPELFKR